MVPLYVHGRGTILDCIGYAVQKERNYSGSKGTAGWSGLLGINQPWLGQAKARAEWTVYEV